eukprot:gnl/Spiro4/590_TR338_c0_g1_i1.p1 gnl/Spiro4/590_TR338_c0_g1~~gnl/Spiro4/590_TR338_c0_g1_i1.p1  ORF type:complete len:142 (-),score=30.10 gnl/Spiro4/590_TR338_c0_g1_i1:241-624(-)
MQSAYSQLEFMFDDLQAVTRGAYTILASDKTDRAAQVELGRALEWFDLVCDEIFCAMEVSRVLESQTSLVPVSPPEGATDIALLQRISPLRPFLDDTRKRHDSCESFIKNLRALNDSIKTQTENTHL